MPSAPLPRPARTARRPRVRSTDPVAFACPAAAEDAREETQAAHGFAGAQFHGPAIQHKVTADKVEDKHDLVPTATVNRPRRQRPSFFFLVL